MRNPAPPRGSSADRPDRLRPLPRPRTVRGRSRSPHLDAGEGADRAWAPRRVVRRARLRPVPRTERTAGAPTGADRGGPRGRQHARGRLDGRAPRLSPAHAGPGPGRRTALRRRPQQQPPPPAGRDGARPAAAGGDHLHTPPTPGWSPPSSPRTTARSPSPPSAPTPRRRGTPPSPRSGWCATASTPAGGPSARAVPTWCGAAGLSRRRGRTSRPRRPARRGCRCAWRGRWGTGGTSPTASPRSSGTASSTWGTWAATTWPAWWAGPPPPWSPLLGRAVRPGRRRGTGLRHPGVRLRPGRAGRDPHPDCGRLAPADDVGALADLIHETVRLDRGAARTRRALLLAGRHDRRVHRPVRGAGRVIGYYVHHQGRGHLHRALCVARHARAPVTGLSSLPRPDGWTGEWIHLPRTPARRRRRRPHGPRTAALGAPPPRRTARQVGGRRRLDRTRRPALLVSDVSVEIAVLARLMGVPVVVSAMRGDRSDPAHRLAYDLADALLAPWPATLPEPGWPRSGAPRPSTPAPSPATTTAPPRTSRRSTRGAAHDGRRGLPN